MIELAYTRKTDVTDEPVDVSEACAQLRIPTDSEELPLVQRLITAARGYVEEYTGRSLAPQTWQLAAPCFLDTLWLPRAAPLQSVTFVKYYDASNVLQTLSTSIYHVPAFEEPGIIQRVYAQVWPVVYDRRDAVRVEYVTGYAVGACPEGFRHAMLLLIGHWYANREAVLVGTASKEIEMAVESLCSDRVFLRPPREA